MKLLAAILLVTAMLSGCASRVEDAQPPAAYIPENPAVTQPAPPTFRPQPAPPMLVIAPGDTLVTIARSLEALGVVTAEEFIAAAQDGDFSEIMHIPDDPQRFFALEGYLFPGQYMVHAHESADEILRRILTATERELSAILGGGSADERSVPWDLALTLASIVQAESLGNDEAKPLVSAVIRTRMAQGMMLQMCMTSFYVRDYIAPFYDGDPARWHELYNTYHFHGLPAGPICNPGHAAIAAALNPAQTAYLFYIWDNDGNFHFAVTYAEHRANVARYLGS